MSLVNQKVFRKNALCYYQIDGEIDRKYSVYIAGLN